MVPDELKVRIPESEFSFATSRSSGPGGQNVNKVNTKVELRYNINKSQLLSDSEKNNITIALKNRINSDGELILLSQSERSQLLNREKVIEKFYKLLSSALTPRQKRVATAPSKASKTIRLETKRKHGNIKKLRKDFSPEDEG